MPDIIPDVDAIPDQPQEMYFVKRSLRWLNDRLGELRTIVDGLKSVDTSAQAAQIADLVKRVGVLEREPASEAEAASVDLPTEACRIYNSSTIALAHDAEVTLTFDTERYDTDDMHSTTVNTSRITFQTAGKYAVGGSVQISNTDGDAMWVWASIRLNGTTMIVEFANASDRGGLGFNGRVNPNTIYEFAVGDYVELRVRQNNLSGGAETAAATPNTSPEFWAHRLS